MKRLLLMTVAMLAMLVAAFSVLVLVGHLITGPSAEDLTIPLGVTLGAGAVSMVSFRMAFKKNSRPSKTSPQETR